MRTSISRACFCFRRFVGWLLLIAAGLWGVAMAADPGAPNRSQANAGADAAAAAGPRVLVVRINGFDLKDGLRFRQFADALQEASREDAPQRPEAVIFQINASGTYNMETASRVVDLVQNLEIPSYAFVDRSALGAGALLALGTDGIYLADGAVIGGARPDFAGAAVAESEDEDKDAKPDPGAAQTLSILKAQVRSIVRRKGHRPEVAVAMVDGAGGLEIGGREFAAPGEVLTLTADEAMAEIEGGPLLGRGIVSDPEEILKAEKLKGSLLTTTAAGLRTALETQAADIAKAKAEPRVETGTDTKTETEGAQGEEAAPGLFSKDLGDSYKGKILVLRVGMNDLLIDARFDFTKRAIKKARKDGASALILDMNTPGGAAWQTGELMMKELQDVNFPTYTFVNPYAQSAGCMIALATDHIYMRPTATIGSALVVDALGGDIKGNMQKKVEAMMRDLTRNVAEAKGHDPEIAEAFVTTDKRIVRAGVIISEPGEVLNLSTTEAMIKVDGEPIFARGVVNSVDELIAAEGLKGEVMNLEPSGLEALAFWVQRFSFILIIIGLAGAYMELNSPGFGVPGVVSILAFSIFFFGNNLAGNLAGYELAVVFVLGLVLLVVEIFILPGALLPGLLGGILLLGSLAFAMVDRFDFHFRWEDLPEAPSVSELLMKPALNLAIGLAGAGFLIAWMMKYFPESRFGSWLVLKHAVPGGASLEELEAGSFEADAGPVERRSLVGLSGISSTDLRPAGKGEFNGRLLDIITDGEFVEKGQPLEIIRHEGSRIVVQTKSNGSEGG